jgi:hypothetical protein
MQRFAPDNSPWLLGHSPDLIHIKPEAHKASGLWVCPYHLGQQAQSDNTSTFDEMHIPDNLPQSLGHTYDAILLKDEEGDRLRQEGKKAIGILV